MAEKELILKLLFIDWSHNSKVERLISEDLGELRDKMYIDLFKIVLDEVGLPSMDYLINRYVEEVKNEDDLEPFYDFLITESEHYSEIQADQSYEARLERLQTGVCPLHGYVMTQIVGWQPNDSGQEYTIIGCAKDNCVKVKYYSEDKQELMPEWLHIMMKWEQ